MIAIISNAYNMRRNAHQIEKGWQEIISYHPFLNIFKAPTVLCLMKAFFKHRHSRQQFFECRFVTKYHRGTHTFVILFPRCLYIRTGNKHYTFAHIWGIVHTSNTCEYFPMVANGLPQLIIIDCIPSKVLVHHS